MTKPLSVQLYSLREYAEKDFAAVLKRVADIGYKAVEPAGFWNLSPAVFKKMIDDLGLKMYSSHSPWARNADSIQEVIDTLGVLGLKNCVCGYGTADFANLDTIKATADNTNKMIEVLEKQGITLFQHNHFWEFERIDGKLKYDYYLEYCPKIKFELDCFWSTNKGTEDSVAMLKRYADRTIMIHMKDGVCTQNAAGGDKLVNGLLDMKIDLLPLGTGSLPIPDLIKNAPAQVDAIVVELDYCATDMWKAIEKSYQYMTSNGLAEGNK